VTLRKHRNPFLAHPLPCSRALWIRLC